MGIIFVSLMMEVILLVVSLFLGIDGGMIRRFISVGLATTGIPLSLAKQQMFNDLTLSYVSSSYPGPIQNAWVLTYSFISLVMIALIFLSLPEFLEARKTKNHQKYMELLV